MSKWKFTPETIDKAPPGVTRTAFVDDGQTVVGYVFKGSRLAVGDWIVDGKLTQVEEKPPKKGK